MASERPYADPMHEGNSVRNHTGRKCIERGCDAPAGTWWSPLWCQACNTKRMDRIGANLKAMLAQFPEVPHD